MVSSWLSHQSSSLVISVGNRYAKSALSPATGSVDDSPDYNLRFCSWIVVSFIIRTLEENAVAAWRRADKAEEYNRQLEALYKQRITELEEEIRLYQSLESTIHGIVMRQLEKQPEEV
jgi:hypothetical protein